MTQPQPQPQAQPQAQPQPQPQPQARLNPIYTAMPVTVFEHMSGLARSLGAINLGQGFPDAPPPAALTAAAMHAMETRSQQYPPSAGVPELRDAVAAYYARTQGLALALGHLGDLLGKLARRVAV